MRGLNSLPPKHAPSRTAKILIYTVRKKDQHFYLVSIKSQYTIRSKKKVSFKTVKRLIDRVHHSVAIRSLDRFVHSRPTHLYCAVMHVSRFALRTDCSAIPTCDTVVSTSPSALMFVSVSFVTS